MAVAGVTENQDPGSFRGCVRRLFRCITCCALSDANTSNLTPMKPRIIMRIELSPDAKREFIFTPERLGMTQLAVTNKLIAWFLRQSADMQLAILRSHYDRAGENLTTEVLRRIISETKESVPRGRRLRSVGK